MAYTYLPGVFTDKQDGGLAILESNLAPKVIDIGTSDKGPAEQLWVVGRAQEAAVTFGTSGTLIRGMYESKSAGAENLLVFRIGATAAVLQGIGVDAATGGIVITTSTKDDSAETDYSLVWDNTTHVLQVYNVASGAVIFERDFDSPLPTVDLGEITISGTFIAGQGLDIGAALAPLTFAVVAAGAYVTTLTSGADGTNPSRMEMYENLFRGYRLLENEDLDFVVPMDVYLNDLNVGDLSASERAALDVASAAGTYPVPVSTNDALLYFYHEEYQGSHYFWWRKDKATGQTEIARLVSSNYANTTHADHVNVWDTTGDGLIATATCVWLRKNVPAQDTTVYAGLTNLSSGWDWTAPLDEDFDVQTDTMGGAQTVTLNGGPVTTQAAAIAYIQAQVDTAVVAGGGAANDLIVEASGTGATIRRNTSAAANQVTTTAGPTAATLDAFAAGSSLEGMTAAVYQINGTGVDLLAPTDGDAAAAAAAIIVEVHPGNAGYNSASQVAAIVDAQITALGPITNVTNANVPGATTVTLTQTVAGFAPVPVSHDDAGTAVGSLSVFMSVSNSPQIYSTGYATATPSGVDLTSTTFHEVNFAYQLANFCYNLSTNVSECHGMIGVKPPAGLGAAEVAVWIGTEPTYTLDANNELVISGPANNGDGLFGNKFMAGRSDFRSGVAYGGFIASDNGYLDGTELEDRGGHVIDIGQYISTVGAWLTVYNSYDTSGLGYITNFASSYSGMVAALDAKSAPTNKVVESVSLPFRISNIKMDALAGFRYIFCQDKAKGTVVADAPTAARPDSDYNRLTTVRIVKQVVDAVRLAADPFIGEAGGASQRAALQTAIENKLAALQKDGYIQRYELSVTATPAQIVQGQATVELVIVPAFELRQITLVISLAAI